MRKEKVKLLRVLIAVSPGLIKKKPLLQDTYRPISRRGARDKLVGVSTVGFYRGL